MTSDVALILGIDGLANGAVYLLAGLGLVLIFSVTRVVFVPVRRRRRLRGAHAWRRSRPAALPPTIGLVRDAGRARASLTEVGSLVRRGEYAAHPARASLGWGVLPALPCLPAWAIAGRAVPAPLQVAVAVLLVVPIIAAGGARRACSRSPTRRCWCC